ncbi:hypothetical protein [Geomicrobium sp. JCM 19055]|uniref:hypothetical protein n=1 Tax=Geomicrobium sp. JCM 19055 TaxID=1460649 RepID=UPI00045ED4B2|nr:hypothetical protein [Geomicrobium sp. JCM 19055]GAJ97781.1 hypothetical protein JCM19055_659 [Geomicrobium sp. JCM 19055]
MKNLHIRFPHSIEFKDPDAQIEKLNEMIDESTLLQSIITLPIHTDNSKELRKLSSATKKGNQKCS